MRLRRSAVLAAGVLLLAGCGLPLGGGVREPGPVPAEQLLRDDVQVLPPGPRPGATPEAVVRGFLSAQSSSDRGHAIAREYLVPELRTAWRDDTSVLVYDPQTEQVEPVPGAAETVRFQAKVIGAIGTDGAYSSQTPVEHTDTFRAAKVGGEWRLAQVPTGLRLTPGDRDRSFRASSTYYLAPTYDGGQPTHLVADAVLLPVQADPAQALVTRLLSPPSTGLATSALTAVPAGTALLRPVTTSATGLVTVDLSPDVDRLNDLARSQLTAQLVWTLRGLGGRFAALRLLAGGRPLLVAGSDRDQPRDAWADYAPDGHADLAPAFAVVDGRLGRLDVDGPTGGLPPLAEPGGPVVAYALSRPDGARLAVLTGQRNGPLVLRTGPARGPLVASRVPASRLLASPSWGSGEVGVWLLRTGSDPALLRVDDRGMPTVVGVEGGLARLGPLRALRVSRDGARVALVAGGRLWVGRVVPDGHEPSVVGLRDVAPALTEVTDVSWASGTSLVALGRLAPIGAPVPVRVAVDGSSLVALSRLGLQGEPLSVAAADGRPLLVATRVDGVDRTSRDNGRFFERLVGSARNPLYPD
jgi:Lipoprotein LpqB beta-propeller domain/Sporulation and spore germination